MKTYIPQYGIIQYEGTFFFLHYEYLNDYEEHHVFQGREAYIFSQK